jgi:hypothetical protein
MQTLWKSVWKFLRKLKIDLPLDPVYILGHKLEECKLIYKRNNTSTSMFIAALFPITKL